MDVFNLFFPFPQSQQSLEISGLSGFRYYQLPLQTPVLGSTGFPNLHGNQDKTSQYWTMRISRNKRKKNLLEFERHIQMWERNPARGAETAEGLFL